MSTQLRVKLQNTHPALQIISLEIVQTGIILLHSYPQVIYYKCVKFHQYLSISEGVAFIRHNYGKTERQGDFYIPLNFVRGGGDIWIYLYYLDSKMSKV